jgi:biotin---protein ligase
VKCADFVKGGGAYLGICAGAYYASERVEFEAGTALTVEGPRELAFFTGTALGSVVPDYDYHGEVSAAAVPLWFKVPKELMPPAARGPQLAPRGSTSAQSGAPAQAELDSPDDEAGLDRWTVSDMWPRQARLDWRLPVPDGHVASESVGCAVARDGHCMASGTRCSGSTASRGEREPGGPGCTWQQCTDYVNGGPCFLLGSSDRQREHEEMYTARAPEIIARYAATGRVSALKVSVGMGAAVLCGSHPEFDSEGMGAGRPDLHNLLHGAGQNASQRALLFMTLLHSLGLGPVIHS